MPDIFPLSQIRDPDGNLMRFYHGSKYKFREFELGHSEEALYFGDGLYFTANRQLAATYAGNTFGQDSEGYIYEVLLNIRNPYRTMSPLVYKEEFEGMSSKEIQEELIERGHDGVVHVFWNGELYDDSTVVAFNPSQIEITSVKFPDRERPDLQGGNIMENTYWSGNGKYQAFVEHLEDKLPSWGYTSNVYMNLFITMSHLYYDAYNNGGGNIPDCYMGDFHRNVKPYLPDINPHKFIDFDADILEDAQAVELAMDQALEFLKDKDLSFHEYKVWSSNKEECISRIEPSEARKAKGDWFEVTFGSPETMEDWCMRRQRNLGQKDITEEIGLPSFFYTFGTSESFPYQKGWVKVKAKDREQADQLFRKYFPDKTPGYLNCSSIYTSDLFKSHYLPHCPVDWCLCHATITPDSFIKRELGEQVQSAVVRAAAQNTDHNQSAKEPERS